MRHGWLHPRSLLEPLVWAKRTDRVWERLLGLLGRPAPARGTGLLISHSRTAHSFGLRYALDVVFLSADWRILDIARGLRPWRRVAFPAAAHVLELAAGEADRLRLAPGQNLQWVEDRARE